MKCLLAIMLGLGSTVAWGMDADDFRVLNEIRKDTLQVLSNQRFLKSDQTTQDAATQDILRLGQRLEVASSMLDLTSGEQNTVKGLIETLAPETQPGATAQSIAETIQSQRQRLIVVEADLRKMLFGQMTEKQQELAKTKTGKQLSNLRNSILKLQTDLFGTKQDFAVIEYDLGRWVESAALVEDMTADADVKDALKDLGRLMDERKALQFTFSNVSRLEAAYFDTIARAVAHVDDMLKLAHESRCETNLTAGAAPALAAAAMVLPASESALGDGSSPRRPITEIIRRTAPATGPSTN